VARDGGRGAHYGKGARSPGCRGVTDFVIDKEESYDEEFGCGKPDTDVFYSVFGNGQDSARDWRTRSENGRVFYFRPDMRSTSRSSTRRYAR